MARNRKYNLVNRVRNRMDHHPVTADRVEIGQDLIGGVPSDRVGTEADEIARRRPPAPLPHMTQDLIGIHHLVGTVDIERVGAANTVARLIAAVVVGTIVRGAMIEGRTDQDVILIGGSEFNSAQESRYPTIV